MWNLHKQEFTGGKAMYGHPTGTTHLADDHVEALREGAQLARLARTQARRRRRGWHLFTILHRS